MREAEGQEKPQRPRDSAPPGLSGRQVSGLSVCYLQRSTIFQAKNPDRIPECEGMQRLEDERRWLSVPKVYVLQPWILNLLMKYEQLESRNTQVPGHILKHDKLISPGDHAELISTDDNGVQESQKSSSMDRTGGSGSDRCMGRRIRAGRTPFQKTKCQYICQNFQGDDGQRLQQGHTAVPHES